MLKITLVLWCTNISAATKVLEALESAKIRVCQRRAARNWANVEAGRCKQKHATSSQVGESGAAHASPLLIATLNPVPQSRSKPLPQSHRQG